MSKLPTNRTQAPRLPLMMVLICGFWFLTQASTARAQAAAEAAGATSVTSAASATTPKVTLVPPAKTQPGTSSPHITPSMSASSPEANRAALEAKAGRDAARLLLRSMPSRAQVWIDGKAVGPTPVLLILAPGKYKIELRGTRQEHAQRECALLPKETQEVVMDLQKTYPSRVVAH